MELVDTPLPDVLEHIHLRSLVFYDVTFLHDRSYLLIVTLLALSQQP